MYHMHTRKHVNMLNLKKIEKKTILKFLPFKNDCLDYTKKDNKKKF